MPRTKRREFEAQLPATPCKPEMRERMLAAGLEPVGDPPEQFAAYVRTEVVKWAKVIQQAGIRID